MVTNNLFSCQAKHLDNPDQGGREMISSNLMRGNSTASVRLFPLFEPAANAAQQINPKQIFRRITLRPDGSPVLQQEGQPGNNENSPEALANPDAVLEQVREEAAAYMQEANAAAETIKSNAYQEGLQQGRHDAQEEVSQRFQAVIQSFDQATEQILGLRQEVLRRAEEDIISLGFNLAAKIIGQQIQNRPDIFITILRRAIERSASPDRIVIHVNPDDLQIAQEQQHDLLRNLGHIRQFTIETDPTIERGGCTVQSDLGEIDARIDAQLEELEQGLREQYSAATENNPS